VSLFPGRAEFNGRFRVKYAHAFFFETCEQSSYFLGADRHHHLNWLVSEIEKTR
jgi:hypothetical protein